MLPLKIIYQSTQGRLFIAANVTKRTGKDGKQEMIKVEDDGANECVMYEFLEAVVRLGLLRYKGEYMIMIHMNK